jgi:hypothetical protein
VVISPPPGPYSSRSAAKVPEVFLARIVIPSFAEPENVYESFSAGALMVPDKICPQLIGVWARTIRGNDRIAIGIKTKMKNLNFDLGIIFQPSFINQRPGV